VRVIQYILNSIGLNRRSVEVVREEVLYVNAIPVRDGRFHVRFTQMVKVILTTT
jgi:hypothetical protein